MKNVKSVLTNLRAWLEDRTGLPSKIDSVLNDSVPGGASAWYVFGSVMTVLLAVEAVTGVLLSAYYAPSAQTAWASTAFIQDQLTAGWFVRGLHSFGSTALIIVAILHLLQVLVWGAYKKPRELNWILGLLMLLLLVSFALSGYSLPWDQKGYWAKQVETSIMGTTPVLGPIVQTLFQGGSSYGNVSVTHWFTLHAMVLPAILFALVGAHVALFRRHKVTPRWGRTEADIVRSTEPYMARQGFLDALASFATVAIVALFVVKFHGAELEAPADPAGNYNARPEWYAIPLYQLRMYFEGPLEMVATMIIPGVGGTLVALLPWLDRSPTTDPRKRPKVMAGTAAAILGIAVLSIIHLRKDAADAEYQAFRKRVEHESVLARQLALKGVLPQGGTAVWMNDPEYETKQLWKERCSGCHSLDGGGSDGGPDLADYNSRAWLTAFYQDPYGKRFFGTTKKPEKNRMPKFDGTDEELAALVELVYAESGAADVKPDLVAKAKELFSDKDCDSCHELDGETGSRGPNLKGRGTLAYTIRVISDSSHEVLYGKRGLMPKFSEKLSKEQIEALAKFVLAQKK